MIWTAEQIDGVTWWRAETVRRGEPLSLVVAPHGDRWIVCAGRGPTREISNVGSLLTYEKTAERAKASAAAKLGGCDMTWTLTVPVDLRAELLLRVDKLTDKWTARSAVLSEALVLGVAALEARDAHGRDCLGTVAAELAAPEDRVRLQEPAPSSGLFGPKWTRQAGSGK